MAGSQFEGPSCLEATSWPATAPTITLCCGTVLSVSWAAGCWVATLWQSVPSGELTFCHGKSPFLMGKSTISMVIFNSFLYVHQRVDVTIDSVDFFFLDGTYQPFRRLIPVCFCLAARTCAPMDSPVERLRRLGKLVPQHFGMHWKKMFQGQLGLSENVGNTPLYPMVLLIIIPMKNGYFIGKINPTFSDKPRCRM